MASAFFQVEGETEAQEIAACQDWDLTPGPTELLPVGPSHLGTYVAPVGLTHLHSPLPHLEKPRHITWGSSAFSSFISSPPARPGSSHPEVPTLGVSVQGMQPSSGPGEGRASAP